MNEETGMTSWQPVEPMSEWRPPEFPTWMDVADGHENRYHVSYNWPSHEVRAGTGTQIIYATKFGKLDAESVALSHLTAFHDGIQVALDYMKGQPTPPKEVKE
jgi:hypothetical protein